MPLALILASTLLVTPLVLVAQSDPVDSTGSVDRYSTADTDLGTLIDDPAARAILDKYVPGLSKSPPMVRSSTPKALQGYALDKLSDDVLAKMDEELARLTPISQPSSAHKVPTVNVNEARVGPYVLPDPLTLSTGEPVRDQNTWWTKRRPEIHSMFESLLYGRAPGRPHDMHFEIFDAGTSALNGKATRKQVLIHLSKDASFPQIQLVEYVPAAATKPVPMLLMLSFTAPSSLFDDPGIRAGMVWDPITKKKKIASRSQQLPRPNIEKFLDAGIGVAAYYYGDIDPDFAGGYALGIRSRFDKVEESARAPDAWGSIAAWAWSLSRVQDYFETDPAIDAKRVSITGASRLGKTVLWAAAHDQRFAAVIACCSGKLGAALLRRNFGERIDTAGGDATYWLAPNSPQFVGREATLPMDAHMLLALIAPRPVLLQTGKYDHAADPKGEFLAAVAAGPVYELLGKQGLGKVAWPPSEPILNDVGYHMNDRGHGMVAGDWDIYLEFLKRHLLRKY